MTTRLLLDIDTGIDDAIALILALRSPGAAVLAIGTVGGNVDAERAALNTLAVLEVLGAQIPVAVGLDDAWQRRSARVSRVHGVDGLGEAGIPAPGRGPSGEHAVDQLIRLARAWPGEITLCTCGPLTNVAAALRREPDLPMLLKEVVIMGGAADPIGNAAPVAEANILLDPEAAQAVFAAPWPRTMVGLDVTMQALLRQADLDRLAASSQPAARFAARISRFYFDYYTRVIGCDGCAMHDPLAVAIALDRTLITRGVSLDVRVETEGALTRGMTVADRRRLRAPGYPPPARPTTVALAVDVARFHAVLMAALLQGPQRY